MDKHESRNRKNQAEQEAAAGELQAIKEVIVVEGRDDTAAIKKAVDADTIETHGFGIRRATWELIEKAYKERGIIIFTDPDYSGNEIRRRLKERFPSAKEAFLARDDAERDGDIGIENACPQAIKSALGKAHFTLTAKRGEFTATDLLHNGLAGGEGAKKRREKLGRALGIGYANTHTLIDRLNRYGITREEYNEALRTIDD
ncbi:MAG: ribonuclease M5 [Firmicutes bacterium]|nr:ribonuclease M5 [Bacillota bacterium]